MEKYTDLVRQIKEAVRAKALEIPRFAEKKEGCIRITSCPECQGAFEWMGCNGEYEYSDMPDIEDAYVILPGGTRVARFENPDGSVEIIDTYAMTAMKIAQLSYIQDSKHALLSGGEVKGLSAENGFAPWRGALCCEIYSDYRNPNGGNCRGNGAPPFCLIYVSVSGASEDEDLACAGAAIKVIQDFFTENGKYIVRSPLLD